MRVLDRDGLREKGIPFTAMHLRRLVKAKRLPQPIHVGLNRLGWVEAEIDEWLNARVAERDAVTTSQQKTPRSRGYTASAEGRSPEGVRLCDGRGRCACHFHNFTLGHSKWMRS
jgi:prophage regulatory protein